jgi:hypothetical protein
VLKNIFKLFVLVIFRVFVFFFFITSVVCVWQIMRMYDNESKTSYVLKETEDLVGVWKVRGKNSYLILRSDGLFEFHRPLESEHSCLPKKVIVFNSTKCGVIIIGRWTHMVKDMPNSYGMRKCGAISLGGRSTFTTIEYHKCLRLIVYGPVPIILDKVSSHSQRCPACLMNLPHDVEKSKPYEYLDKFDSGYWYEKEPGVVMSLFI